MRPIVRVIGKILRLVGISSPEDSHPKACDSLRSTFLAHAEAAYCKAARLKGRVAGIGIDEDGCAA
jgi:hypothetical protein